MRSARVYAGLGALGLAGVLSFACGDDPAAFSFLLSVDVIGNGSVTSHPAAITCDGPKNCGGTTLTVPDVVLSATPSAGFAFTGWILDGTVKDPSTLAIHSSGEAHAIIAKFAPGGPGSPPGTPGTPPGNLDGGNDGEAGAPPFVCGAAGDCSSGRCCVVASIPASTAPASCKVGDEPCNGNVATCLKNSDCGDGSICCFDNAGPVRYECMTEAACKAVTGRVLCGDGYDCEGQTGYSCFEVNSAIPIARCTPSD